jgi:hypothetical protein
MDSGSQHLGWVLAFWTMAIAVPYALCIVLLAVAPPIAIGLASISNRNWVLFGKRGSGKPSLEGLILLCPLALLVRAFRDLQVLDWQEPLIAAGIMGIALAVAAWFLIEPDRRDRIFVAACTVALGVAWGWGVTTLTNAAEDTVPTRFYASAIEDRRISSGRSTSYYLRLAPWGPVAGSQQVGVGRVVYDQMAGAAVACIDLHDGLFGWRWHVVHRCASGEGGASRSF